LLIVLSILLAGCGTGLGATPTAELTAPMAGPIANPTSIQPAPTATTVPTSPTPDYTPTATPTASSTPTPIPTPTPTPLPGASLIAFESNRDGNAEVYVLNTETGESTNLTRHPAEDRAPAWRPDGGAIAFESRRDGNWEIYVLDLSSGQLQRLTDDPAYDGAPAWSPDGQAIAFESYRDGNLEIYVLDTAGGEPRRLTDNAAGDYGPAWSPDGQDIAWTSWRDGNKDVYVATVGRAEGGEARNLTQNPSDDEDPAWSPDGGEIAFVSWRDEDSKTGNRNAEIYTLPAGGGTARRAMDNLWPDQDPAWDAEGRLVWAAYDPGLEFETYDPYRPGAFHLYRSSPAGPARLTETSWDDRRPAPAPAHVLSLQALLAVLPATTAIPPTVPALTAAAGEYRPVEVPSILTMGYPILVNELVVPSLLGWQQAVLEASGYDLLANTLGSWRPIESVGDKRFAHDYAYLSWHKTGRALDVALEYKVDGVDQMLVARDDLGESLYWRMILRAARQDGSLGEPLKDNPWRYWWQIVEAHEPEAYAAGGKRLPIPAGYYVDITAIARRHGWARIATYALEGDYDWHQHSRGTEYWHYERADGLTWWEAMSQIYKPELIEQYFAWNVALGQDQSVEMLRSKGIPEP